MSCVTVYQDGEHRDVEVAVREFMEVRLVRLPAKPPRDDKAEAEAPVLSSRLTFNYRFMLEHALLRNGDDDFILVLEDDLEVARRTAVFRVGRARHAGGPVGVLRERLQR